MSGEVWVHGDVRCERCGYDSQEAHQRHVWQHEWKSLECPRCRSYECVPVDRDEDGNEVVGEETYEFEIPEGLTVMAGAAVFDCSDEEGVSHAVVVGDDNARKVQTMGLLVYGLEAVKQAVMEED